MSAQGHNSGGGWRLHKPRTISPELFQGSPLITNWLVRTARPILLLAMGSDQGSKNLAAVNKSKVLFKITNMSINLTQSAKMSK